MLLQMHAELASKATVVLSAFTRIYMKPTLFIARPLYVHFEI